MEGSTTKDELQLTPEIRAKIRDSAAVRRELLSGKSAQEILGISLPSLAECYRVGRELLDQKRYHESAHVFLFLVTLNGDFQEYWLGFGMALQMCKNYEGAIDAYEMAASCEVDNPIPYFYLAKCLYAIHDWETAKESLALAIEYATDRDEYIELKQKALEAQRVLAQQK